MAYSTELRTYIGRAGVQPFDGWAGFRIGQTYPLQVEYREGDKVAIVLTHRERMSPSIGPLVIITKEQYEQWFRKQEVIDSF